MSDHSCEHGMCEKENRCITCDAPCDGDFCSAWCRISNKMDLQGEM